MLVFSEKSTYLFQADANALGGELKEPIPKLLDTQAPISLSAAGGFARAQSGAFNHDHVVHCSSTFAVVRGTEAEQDLFTTHAVAVVENLNILEVIRADRIETRVAVTASRDGKVRKITLAGTRFEGLVVGERAVEARFNEQILKPDPASDGFLKAVERQAQNVIGRFKQHSEKDAAVWAEKRHFSASRHTRGKGTVLCSVVDAAEGADNQFGHIVEIPGIGRIFLGELLISPHSVRLISIRADLGCKVRGGVYGPTAMISGGQDGGHA